MICQCLLLRVIRESRELYLRNDAVLWFGYMRKKVFIPRRAYAARVTVLVLCVCVSVANLRTGASRRLTEDTSGLSGTFFTKV